MAPVDRDGHKITCQRHGDRSQQAPDLSIPRRTSPRAAAEPHRKAAHLLEPPLLLTARQGTYSRFATEGDAADSVPSTDYAAFGNPEMPELE
jgi:hypothetical protein